MTNVEDMVDDGDDDDDDVISDRCAGFVGANASTTTAHDVLQMAAAVTTEHVVALGRRLGRGRQRWQSCLCAIVMVEE